MSMDGSFSVESALTRFVARCPQLASVPQLGTLVQKGHNLTEEEVVNSVAELFLHPKYTIPLVGCFRPIIRRIVEKAVALLRLVSNLSSNVDVTAAGPVSFDDDAINIIEFHVRNDMGLNLHELACLALCRSVDLAPFLLGLTLSYFKFAPPPFERILKKGKISELSTKVVARYLLSVRTSYRFLVMEPDVFSKLWDWSCFLDFAKKSLNLKLGNGTEFEIDTADIRWCGIQIISIILKMRDRAIANFGVGAEEAFSCLLRWEDFCQDTAIEKAGSYIFSSAHIKLLSSNGDSDHIQNTAPQSSSINFQKPSMFHEIEPSLRRRRLLTGDDRSSGSPFVMTSTLKKSFEMVLLAVSQKWPALLYGPAGAGKSALISKLAQDSGNQVLSIFMDDQIDGKTLVGSYVCTDQPGEFKWQPGSLTQAVLYGFWVVIEDVDKAPSDVLPIILPLLEGSSFFETGHGEEIRVAESFRLFSTISTSKSDISHSTEGGKMLNVLWRKVMIGPPSNEDLLDIVKAWYPDLEPLAGRLVETFDNIRCAPLHQLFGLESRNSSSFSSLSLFSLRDLLKWCKRITGLNFSSFAKGLSAYECHYIYQEAIDIFAAFSMSIENRLSIMKEIAKMWAITVSGEEILHPHKPIIQDLLSELRIGRITLQRTQNAFYDQKTFVELRNSMNVLERIACSVKYNESVLLVGETGTGKTTLVQNLAKWLGQRLTVLNLSQQSDVTDLLGGFKPVDAHSICIPLYKEFEDLFSKTFSMEDNAKVFGWFQEHLRAKNWKKLLRGFKKTIRNVVFSFENKVEERSASLRKRKKSLEEQLKAWENFSVKIENAHRQMGASSGMVFSFVEGAFVSALRNGEWILLDEVNLAPPETLQRVTGVLDGEYGSLCLTERGDVRNIHRHPNFRLFACMNPATDAGKRDLPYSLRSRFTEYFVDDILGDDDLQLFIDKFMGGVQADEKLKDNIKKFYKSAKKASEERLQDGANQKPQFSLRSLYRALEYTRKAERKFVFQKALYDGFCMFFLTLLDGPSTKIMNKMIVSELLGGNEPRPIPFGCYLTVKENLESNNFLKNYVITDSVERHLRNLSRAIFIRRYPVLLQGPTSSGKTSLVQYLADLTGHRFVRINNHEHTDLQEYLGSYITDSGGKLVFNEGVLVQAVRNGYWIVLDELNLAPSDVLEALNRLLDDNRELFVPELQETVRAHPDFMLFATQNPPTLYGGRKMLSRAFRNRFVEIHVDEIPAKELSTILEKRCQIPGSYAKKMVEVMVELQLHRQNSKVFAGKHGYITPRDLFRWADRFRAFGKSYEDLARDGYYLLAERLRDEGEKCVVQEVLERNLRVKLVKEDLYKQLREPVLLVGETGGGKTTVCQLLSVVLGLKLHILNCHQYTETSDFLGGFYPVRERSMMMAEFNDVVEQLMLSKAFPKDFRISSDISLASLTLDHLDDVIKNYGKGQVISPDVTVQDIDMLEKMKLKLAKLYLNWQTIFMWQDGPLVQAMKAGDLFLVDEISLADDSVLERLNSVLEPERKLSLAEKGGPLLEILTAHPNFFILATMNPGGDFGKKELSPALRNRFTEIWVPPVSDLLELRDIAMERFCNAELARFIVPMLSFWEWFNQLQTGKMLTVRDLLSWVAFINSTGRILGPELSFLHGVFLVLLDGLSLGTGISRRDAEELRQRCLSFLLEQLNVCFLLPCILFLMENYGWGDLEAVRDISCSNCKEYNNIFGIHPFFIEKGFMKSEVGGFELSAPTTRRNALRVLRALQLPKPVLLEGSPGVGKTSLVVALGKFSGHKVVRINLSEQTDIMDLLGSDLPVESDEGMKFAWSDGILLEALKEGCWVLLDELNLAPQSGLNAILDHRAEVFIPELGLTFKCPQSFRVFACQNPSYQGGGRKGLPKSFLNRFTKVYVDELAEDDYLFICSSLYPSIPRALLSKLILFNQRLHEETMLYHKFAQDGSPWEFNLRDVMRSCEVIQGAPEKSKVDCFLDILYVQRMRTAADRREVLRLYEEIFGGKPSINPYPRVQMNSRYLIVGNTAIKRNYFQSSKISSNHLKIMPEIRQVMQAAAQCIKHQWLCILIGPPSSGKTSLIRLLAQLSGNVLNELNLSSATDISELLGCFEQYDALRKVRLALSQVESYMNEYCSLQSEYSVESFATERKNLITRWLALLSDSSAHVEQWKSGVESLPLLAEIIEELKLSQNTLPVSWSSEELDRIMKTILKLQEDQKGRSYSAKFEWVTGLLIKAIEKGEWIVLENANLCSPTVLDRINSLVEPSGTITVNECGIVDGKPVVLHPHSNFRMFLTVNPSCGEVSRAMRNRGVEIFMLQPYWLLDNRSGYSCEEMEVTDVQRFLVLSGIPTGKLVDAMAKAHIYATNEALRLSVHVTYLELARWVQLFQQLLMNGNEPLWSLQISWEHTYLSSLGEAEGAHIVSHGNISYLSVNKLYEDFLMEKPLCLPGGWPNPLKLRDFIWYSKEVSVKQNCMYLEFLGGQYALHISGIASNSRPLDQSIVASSYVGTYVMDSKTLREIMFPTVSTGIIPKSGRETEFGLDLANKILFFAANWTIEQATKSDLHLYLSWFSWFNSQLQPYCQFFRSFLKLLKDELKHSIWEKYIFPCHQELISLNQVEIDLQPIPVLSLELVESTASDCMSEFSRRCLCNAVNCVGLLRLTYRQWNDESEHNYTDETRPFKPFLNSLQVLEKDVLDILVESRSFDVLRQLYIYLLEDHMQFWKGVSSSQYEHMLFSWRCLLKDIGRLEDFCPRAVKIVLMESKNVEKVSSWHCSSDKSLLLVHGGHPFLPSSPVLFHKQHQILELCELVWPTKIQSLKQVNLSPVEFVASSNPELRFLAVQGASISSYIMSKCDGDDGHPVEKLEEMYQMLLQRFEHEKRRLGKNLGSDEDDIYGAISACCCVVCPEMLCMKSCFDSWLGTLPIFDSASFFLDMELLQELSLLDPEELVELAHISKLLESVLQFSVAFSSRQPQVFLPHQKLLWALDASTSEDAVNAKITSYVHEFWFRWHSSMWSHVPVSVKNFLKIGGNNIPQPEMLFQPVRTVTVIQILQSTSAIKDHCVCCMGLKIASSNFWQDFSSGKNLPDYLLSVARCLFRKIIYAHKKSFDAAKFADIKTILSVFESTTTTHDDVQHLSSLIALTSHHKLKSSVHMFIEPLLGELYVHYSSTDFHYNLGCAWLRIGALRYTLLLCHDDLDPAMKYYFKYSQLEEKISSLELEIKARQESDYLAGWLSMRESNKNRARTLENLQIEGKMLKRKIVFRPDQKKFKKLKEECGEFLEFVLSLIAFVGTIDGMNLEQIVDQVCNCQATATCFNDRLSDEYFAYVDIVQPVQVAIYEMKLGISLVLSSVLHKNFLNTVREDNMDRIMELVYSFMRFPGGFASKFVSVNLNSGLPKTFSHHTDIATVFCPSDMSLLEKLVAVSRDGSAEKKGSVLEIHHNILARVSHHVANAKLMDNESFMILDKIFCECAKTWMNIKVQIKTKEDSDAQQYKFRPRDFKIESVLDVDISSLAKSVSFDSFPEWQQLLSKEELTETMETSEKSGSSEEEWNLLQESTLNNMVKIHNQLFGSSNLVKSPGAFEISDSDRLRSFSESYSVGVEIIKGLRGLYSSGLDAKLLPEHLLRLCLEHEQKFVSPHKSGRKYNFYKDSNAPVMAQMVKLLVDLKNWISGKREELPDLQKIFNLIDMLLAIPSSTPIAKALTGLQFLLHKARVLQENGSKIPLGDRLKPVVHLVCSWQEMEFRSWPALLDDVQDQFEINAAKLWFPLYSVLQREHSGDIPEYVHSTYQSLEEFIQKSNVGEFRKRLQLLLAFHGQIIAGRQLGIYSTSFPGENVNILYNVFGFYVQFLPIILEHIEVNRKDIEKKLKDDLKLCRWGDFDYIEYAKKTRQRFGKLIEKFTDILQTPVILLFQEAAEKGMLNATLDQSECKDEDSLIGSLWCRSIWHVEWKEKLDDALLNLHFPFSFFKDAEEVLINIKQCLLSHSTMCLLYMEDWKDLWSVLENISTTTISCSVLWNNVNSRVGKRRALTDLLKLLESSGLCKHKYNSMEVSNQSNSWFLQPSYDARHLLLAQSRLSNEVVDVSLKELQFPTYESLDTEWKSVNEFYFKSMASVQFLGQISLNPHKDITSDQASRSLSFINHLIVIQEMQRSAAYGFAKKFVRFGEVVSTLGNLFSKCPDNRTGSECSISQNQYSTLNCMWQQKQLFDSLSTMLIEASLLLRTVENVHLSSCQSVKVSANRVLALIEKYIPVFQESKVHIFFLIMLPYVVLETSLQEALDNNLVGCKGIITTVDCSFHPRIISKETEQLLFKNFRVIEKFEEHVVAFAKQDLEKSSIKETLLNLFNDIFKSGKLMAEQFSAALEVQHESTNPCEEADLCGDHYTKLETEFSVALKGTYEHIIDVLQKLGSLRNGFPLPEESLSNITTWGSLFNSSVENLSIDKLGDELLETIYLVEKLAEHRNQNNSLSFAIGAHFKCLHSFVELILSYGHGLLRDFLAMHKRVCMLTHVLANVLASLFSKGYGTAKDMDDDCSRKISQDASGTGMGEGSGLNDVSDQIDEEDQLIGASEKGDGEQDASGEVPNKNEKGIEMEQDFAADTFSVSEDSGEDNNEDSDGEQLDSAMGDTGDDNKVVNEKLWNKDEDDNPSDTTEKYESGPSVKDRNVSCRELRAKEESSAIADEPGDLTSDKLDQINEETECQDDDGGIENMEDMNMDKEEAFADPTGLSLDQSNQALDENMDIDNDMDIDEKDRTDSKKEAGSEEHDESAANVVDEEEMNAEDETMTGAKAEELGGTSERDDQGEDGEDTIEMKLASPRKDAFEPGLSDLFGGNAPNSDTATQPAGNSQASASGNVSADANRSTDIDIYNDLAIPRSLPSCNTPETDLMVAGSSNGWKLTDSPPRTQLSHHESSSVGKRQPNPYRSIGDALEDWKERVKVSVDFPADNTKGQGEIGHENADADEYGYVAEFEKGLTQALGPATSEQIDTNVNCTERDGDSLTGHGEEVTVMEIEKQTSEEHPSSILENRMKELMQISDLKKSTKDVSPEVPSHGTGGPGSLSESLVSLKRCYFSEDTSESGKLSISNGELGKVQDLGDIYNDVNNNATAVWRRYELITTGLSQELAEQLRLVMEPSVASKLQGDYKTGKRINMKKVIPYIASQYRKDKIWLRRTRPNKRDYQVIIAVDDSRSMSESCCGNVAIEALVTVCRGMSQLEMGNLAVTSFGKKGNIRLLHDFDQPFTGEVGIKMISSLTFKQENTIEDEPVVDLLKYLHNKLDAAVAKARLPSGQNPLQQLVLIIADGRFHEKENLKRCVRDFLSRKRMVAFLLLDSPNESIMDLQEVSCEDKEIKVSKYLDSFPFPYYIILRNIEALPRTLADLLRQWFELMQAREV
ncbi:AAA_5 domain-containing protein [Cephalotus follicularis]|uniref:Midasin n=1 Tax=Cephalotus follicularis TaxID=3775 RepID=A0A1Q3CJ45_CEPFO|nr:AAA_5 domain-containing protein [Cephalotus follicularis]